MSLSKFLKNSRLAWLLNHHPGLFKLKYAAHLLRKASKYNANDDASHTTALDIISKQQGFSNWEHARELVKQHYTKTTNALHAQHQLITLNSASNVLAHHNNLYLGYNELLDLYVYTTPSLQRCHLFAQGPNAYAMTMTRQWQQHALNNKPYFVWMHQPTEGMIESIKKVLTPYTHIVAIGQTKIPESLHPYQHSWNTEILDIPHPVFILDDGSDKKVHQRVLHHLREHLTQALAQVIHPVHPSLDFSINNERSENKYLYLSNPSEEVLQSLAPLMAQARGYGAACVYGYPVLDIQRTLAVNTTLANTLTQVMDIEATSKIRCTSGPDEHILNSVE